MRPRAPTHKLLEPTSKVPLIPQARSMTLCEVLLIGRTSDEANDISLLVCCLLEHTRWRGASCAWVRWVREVRWWW